jgi:hypothetical protein
MRALRGRSARLVSVAKRLKKGVNTG